MDARSSRYHEVYARWQRDPLGFWGEAAADIDWFETPKTVFDPKAGIYGRWFPDGVCNTCFNAVDRHVEAGRGEQVAIIYDSPLAGVKRTISYHRLLTETQVLGGMLRDLGVGKGDRVILYMPMVPEAAIAMLACARIGAIHSVVFGGFAARELATRIDDATPKVILSASCGSEPGRVVAYKPLLDEAIALAKHKPEACLILQRPQIASRIDRRPRPRLGARCAITRWFTPATPGTACQSPPPIRSTSSTRPARPGGPRAWCATTAATWSRCNGRCRISMASSRAKCGGRRPTSAGWSGIRTSSMRRCYMAPPRFFTKASRSARPTPARSGASSPSTAPWRCSPRQPRFAPSRKKIRMGTLFAQHDLKKFRTLFLAGERADPPTLEWAEALLKVPVIDHWWQTETGWCIAGNPMGLGMLPVKHGSPTVPMPGYDVRVVDEGPHEVPSNKMGSIVIKLPLPPACLPTLWQADARMRESYLDEFPGYYKTADAGFKDDDGYVFVMGRTDDIINVAGHRLSTGGMEEVLAAHPDVAECAVLGIKDELKGEVPCGFIVLKSGVNRPPTEIEKECVALIREKIGPVAAFKLAITVARLPKTRSGKILRGTIKKIADGDTWQMPATIDDPVILDEIGSALKGKGVGA